jgi:acetyltransferase-like isoleucine patch superfamily enzyme
MLHNESDGFFGPTELEAMGFLSIGINVQISRKATLVNTGNMRLGSNVRIDDFTSIICSGSEMLLVGDYVHIGAGAYLGCSGGVVLESFSGLSQGVRIYSASDDYSGETLTNPTTPIELRNTEFASVIVGKHAIVGSGSTLLPGSILGEGVAVGAMSLVRGHLEPWNIYFGIPVRLVRKRSQNLLQLEKKVLKNEN